MFFLIITEVLSFAFDSKPILGSPPILLTVSLFIANNQYVGSMRQPLTRYHQYYLIPIIGFINGLLISSKSYFLGHLDVTLQGLFTLILTSSLVFMTIAAFMLILGYRLKEARK